MIRLIKSKISFERLLNETLRYIEYVVIILLSKKPESFNGLTLLDQIVSDSTFSTVDIFTLNNDTVIEELLKSLNETFCEGFSNDKDGYRFWASSLFENSKINLYKLHGSINWYYYDPESWADRRVCQCSPQITWRDPRKPILLIGTYNKLAEYIKPIFLELFYLFYKTLNKHNTLIVMGYSFGDKGINEKLFDWVLQDNHKMIIIDPNIENLRHKMWDILYTEWDKGKKIVPIKAKSEDINLEEIRGYI